MGEWTELTRRIFPECSILMLEAQESRRKDLETVKQSLGAGVDYRIALLGPEDREDVIFNELTSAPTGSSVLSYRPPGVTRQVRCHMRTLDSIVREAGNQQPDLLKLDVQGYELEVLRGGATVLKHASVVLMEVSLIELYDNNPLLEDVLAFMSKSGFLPYDICSLMRRPSDGVLAQIDMIFVSASSTLSTLRARG
jgi:FkbM family methyltransferase